MGIWEIILIVACALVVIGVIISAIVRKKQGKHSCGYYCDGDCSRCASRVKPKNSEKE